MSRATFVYRDGALVEKFGPLDVRPPRQRSDLPAPSYISDGLADIRGMHDGKTYSSKAALRASYRQAGVVELGNDAPTEPVDNRETITTAEVGEAYRKVRDGYRPAPLPTTVEPD